MRALASLFRSLYSLTRVSAFNDIAKSLYDVERTTNQVKRVKRDAERVKDQMSDDKKNVG